jgi:hypothetical protein
MKEAEWLKAKDPEAMLALVAPHLTPRQWNLLACMFARRVSKLLGDGPFSRAIATAERHGPAIEAGQLAEFHASLPNNILDAVSRAESEQRAPVADCDPDTDPESFQHLEGRKTNPSAPLFQVASDRAHRAIESAGQAAALAAATVSRLMDGVSSAEGLNEVRRMVVEVTTSHVRAGLHASIALKYKAAGDESADRDNGRDVAKRYAAAMERVEREEEYAGYRESDVRGQRERADLKALGRFLLELCGNVCSPPVLDPAWLTRDVVALAESIESQGTFESMPILNDALLDAGCNSRAVLRHCRGLLEHEDQPNQHAPGCWVIAAILNREPAFREKLPLGTASPVKRARKRAR